MRLSRYIMQVIVLRLIVLHAVISVRYLAQAAPLTAVIPSFPIRFQWEHGHGYCGELSIQQTALTHGVWVGQQQARDTGTGELLLGYPSTKQNNLERVVKALGFEYVTWDPDSEINQVKPTSYMRWVKQQIIAGRAVVFGARLEGGEDDEWYDHIMPAYGVSYDSVTAGQYDARDRLLWTDDFGNLANKSMLDPSFFAAQYKCQMPEDTFIGCIPTGAPTFATAMGGLHDSNNLLLPIRLIMSGWSDGSNPAREPIVKTHTVSARYRLAFKPSAKVKPGQRISIYRCDRSANGSGGLPPNPTSGSQLTRAGCRSWSFTMGASTPSQLSHRTLGVLRSNSVVYFVAVLQR
ncbi:hypothetical protein COO60DRAFT_271757 [Scenedesmus sp. NREL 46B-D3]|nr:hypothetical protein COO60DRAFT_271757 [Scenedesmus sp. NREL 46B-D3]